MRKFLHVLYQPYKWLFFAPFFIVNSVVFGTLAVLVSSFSQRLASLLAGVVWARLNSFLTPIFVRVKGRENICKGQSYMIIANHQSFYDIFNPERLNGSRIWLDKSPLSHLFADEIFDTLPSTKYIHILRDPKDNFASVGSSFLKRVRSRVKREALLWRYRIWSAQSFYYAKRNLEKFGAEHYMVVRFRDLCLEPERMMTEIASFIGIPVKDILFQPTRAGYFYPGNNKDGTVFTGISADNISRWKERIPPYYAQVMESQPSEYLQDFNYQQHFSEDERASAIRTHRMITTFIPHSTLFIKFHQCHFQSPTDGIPGV